MTTAPAPVRRSVDMDVARPSRLRRAPIAPSRPKHADLALVTRWLRALGGRPVRR